MQVSAGGWLGDSIRVAGAVITGVALVGGATIAVPIGISVGLAYLATSVGFYQN